MHENREREAEIEALYDGAPDGLGLRYESLTFRESSTESPSGGQAAIEGYVRVLQPALRYTLRS